MDDEQQSNDETRAGETTSHFESAAIIVRFTSERPWEPEIEIPEGASPPMLYAAAESIRFLADLHMSQQMAQASMRQAQQKQGSGIIPETKMPLSLGDFLHKRKGN